MEELDFYDARGTWSYTPWSVQEGGGEVLRVQPNLATPWGVFTNLSRSTNSTYLLPLLGVVVKGILSTLVGGIALLYSGTIQHIVLKLYAAEAPWFWIPKLLFTARELHGGREPEKDEPGYAERCQRPSRIFRLAFTACLLFLGEQGADYLSNYLTDGSVTSFSTAELGEPGVLAFIVDPEFSRPRRQNLSDDELLGRRAACIFSRFGRVDKSAEFWACPAVYYDATVPRNVSEVRVTVGAFDGIRVSATTGGLERILRIEAWKEQMEDEAIPARVRYEIQQPVKLSQLISQALTDYTQASETWQTCSLQDYEDFQCRVGTAHRNVSLGEFVTGYIVRSEEGRNNIAFTHEATSAKYSTDIEKIAPILESGESALEDLLMHVYWEVVYPHLAIGVVPESIFSWNVYASDPGPSNLYRDDTKIKVLAIKVMRLDAPVWRKVTIALLVLAFIVSMWELIFAEDIEAQLFAVLNDCGVLAHDRANCGGSLWELHGKLRDIQLTTRQEEDQTKGHIGISAQHPWMHPLNQSVYQVDEFEKGTIVAG